MSLPDETKTYLHNTKSINTPTSLAMYNDRLPVLKDLVIIIEDRSLDAYSHNTSDRK